MLKALAEQTFAGTLVTQGRTPQRARFHVGPRTAGTTRCLEERRLAKLTNKANGLTSGPW
jgi:hypothetical protein